MTGCVKCGVAGVELAAVRGIDGPACLDCAAALGTATGAADGPQAVGRYAGRVLDLRAMLAAPDEPIPWRCRNLAADGFVTIVAGRGGEGKSWLALALARGVDRGEAVAGIECAAGRSLIFDAENGERLIARRFRAAGISPDSAVQPVESGGLNLLSDIDWFRATIAEQRANFVVFDSLRVLTSGAKESDSDEMEPFVTGLKLLARETQAAIMLIHHRGKSDLSEFRGSSVIRDQTDLLFTFGRVGGDPEARTRRKLTTIKCRIEEEPEPRWLRIVAERDRGLVSLDEAEAYDPEEDTGRPRDDHRGSVLALLEVEAPRSGRSIADELGASEPTIRRVLHDLESDGLAAKHGAGRGAGWVLRQRVTPLGVDALTQFEFGSTEPNSPPRNASRENGAPPAMFDPHSEWS